jgi:uncharacterized protein YndB with AHSA1/START domain
MTDADTTYQCVIPVDDPVIEVRRFFAAPRELVFRAWTEPEIFRLWIGPRYLENTLVEMDVRVGGSYRFVQTAPDGGTHAFRGEYLEVDPPRLLVSTFIYEPMPDDYSVDTVVLEEVDGGTLALMTSRHSSLAARDTHVANGMEGGMNEGFARLDEWIAATTLA